MAKNRKTTPSKKERREALERQRQQQRRTQLGILAVIALAVVALVIWQLWPEETPEPVVLEGERPLAAIVRPRRKRRLSDEQKQKVAERLREYQFPSRSPAAS